MVVAERSVWQSVGKGHRALYYPYVTFAHEVAQGAVYVQFTSSVDVLFNKKSAVTRHDVPL